MVKDFSFVYIGQSYKITSETEDASKLKWWLVGNGEKCFLCDVAPGETMDSLMATATQYLRAQRVLNPSGV